MPSKLGTHGLGRGPSQSLIDAGMRVGKWVNSDPPANLPAGFTAIWRWVRPGDIVHDWLPAKTPEQAAVDWVSEQWEHIRYLPKTTYIEGQNEPSVWGTNSSAWYSSFEITRMQIMEARGYRCCVGNWSTGRPPLPNENDTWEAFVPALRYAAAHGHILGLHEYGYTLDGWNLWRWRKVYDWLKWTFGPDARPKFAITEWGLDGALGPFRDARWRAQYPDPDAAYLALMRAYDEAMRREPLALGFSVYTEGTGGDPAWAPFDIAGQPVGGLMADYIRSQANVPDDDGTGGDEPMAEGPSVKNMTHAAAVIVISPGSTTPLTKAGGHAAYLDDSQGGEWASVVRQGDGSLGRRVGAECWLEIGRFNQSGLALWSEDQPTGFVLDDRGKGENRHIDTSEVPLEACAPPQPPPTDVREGAAAEVINQTVRVRDDDLKKIGVKPIGARGLVWVGPKHFADNTWRFKVDFGDLFGWVGVANLKSTAVEPPAPPPPTGIQVFNGGYELGVKAAPPGISGLLAEGCALLWWATSATPKIDRQDSPWSPPEVTVNSAVQLTADLLPLPEGIHVVHGFKGWAPCWLKYGHSKVHLAAGEVVTSAMVFLDPVERYGPPKVYGADPITAEFRVGFVELSPQEFLNGNAIPYGKWTRVQMEYSIQTEGDYLPYWEYRGRHGMTHNGLFVDDFRVETSEVEPPPPPPPPPPPAGLDLSAELEGLEAVYQRLGDLIGAIQEKLDGG